MVRHFYDAESLGLALCAMGAEQCEVVGLGGNVNALEVLWPGREGLRCWVQCDDGGEGVRAPEQDAADLCVGWFTAKDEAEQREPDWYVCPNDADAADAISELPYRMGLLASNVFHCSTCGHWSDDHVVGSSTGACDAERCTCTMPTRE
jgi:hypothetical protein